MRSKLDSKWMEAVAVGPGVAVAGTRVNICSAEIQALEEEVTALRDASEKK